MLVVHKGTVWQSSYCGTDFVPVNVIFCMYIGLHIKLFTVLKHEQLYLDNLPTAESYEKSYMHRDVITHILVTK